MFWIEVMPWLGAPVQAALHDGAVGGAFGRASAYGSGSPPVDRPSRYAALAGQRRDRAEGLALAQFAGGQAVLAHDDLVARAELRAVQDAGQLQRHGVRPHRVMVGRGHGEGPVGQ